MRFYSISVYDYISLTIRVLRRLTTVDKRRFKVRLFSVSRLDSPAWVSLACLPLRGARTHPARRPNTQALARGTQKIIAARRANRGRMATPRISVKGSGVQC